MGSQIGEQLEMADVVGLHKRRLQVDMHITGY
jgi:hypothetical protein